jgi:hypothetical protein
VATLHLAPGANGSFRETLPAALAAGAPRALTYYVELINDRGRSGGLSNAATVPAGQAPAPITGLTAELRKDGVALHWQPVSTQPYQTQVQLHRTLLKPAATPPDRTPLAAPPEPAQVELLVPTAALRGGALDEDIRFGATYEYRAQRVASVTVDGKTMDLGGQFSPPVTVDASNIFPPAVPTGLAAVATPAQNGALPSIDLSWVPDEEADLGGYAVYRRPAGQPESAWTRVSGPQPVAVPAFHDAQVQSGNTYQYTVTAIGQNGVESARSAAAQEMVPAP